VGREPVERPLETLQAGLEQAKQALPAESVDVLHRNLSRCMDTGAKARVKRAKASIP